MAEPQNPERLLKVENLDVGYGATRVVWDVNLEVDRRQVVSLIGPNGAGKTTLLKALAGLLPVRKGKIIFDGKDVSSEPAHERVQHHLSLVPEGRQLWARMTVEENLLMGGFPSHLRSKAHSNLERIYELFPRLKERRKQLAGTLSGGEQQMCAIGRGLMAEPLRSYAQLAKAIERVAPNSRLVCYPRYVQALPFYCRRRVILVGGKTELAFGSEHDPEGAEYFFIRRADLLKLWNDPRPTVFVIDRFALVPLKQFLGNFNVIASDLKKVAIVRAASSADHRSHNAQPSNPGLVVGNP